MEAKAIAKGLRISPIRARLVADMIRGKNALYQTYALYLLGRCKFNISP